MTDQDKKAEPADQKKEKRKSASTQELTDLRKLIGLKLDDLKHIYDEPDKADDKEEEEDKEEST